MNRCWPAVHTGRLINSAELCVVEGATVESAVLHRRMPSSPRPRSPPYSIEDMTFSEPRTVLFAGMSTPFLAPSWLGTATKVLACSTLSYTVGDKDSIETKLSWRW